MIQFVSKNKISNILRDLILTELMQVGSLEIPSTHLHSKSLCLRHCESLLTFSLSFY